MVGSAELFILVFAVVGLAATAYWVWMLVDAIRTPDEAYRAGTKVVWVLVIVLVGWIGAVIYQLVGRPARA